MNFFRGNRLAARVALLCLAAAGLWGQVKNAASTTRANSPRKPRRGRLRPRKRRPRKQPPRPANPFENAPRTPQQQQPIQNAPIEAQPTPAPQLKPGQHLHRFRRRPRLAPRAIRNAQGASGHQSRRHLRRRDPAPRFHGAVEHGPLRRYPSRDGTGRAAEFGDTSPSSSPSAASSAPSTTTASTPLPNRKFSIASRSARSAWWWNRNTTPTRFSARPTS